MKYCFTKFNKFKVFKLNILVTHEKRSRLLQHYSITLNSVNLAVGIVQFNHSITVFTLQ